MARQRVVITVGLPGSGKSTWVRQQPLPFLSSDLLRGQLTGDERDQTQNRQIFSTLRAMLRQRLRSGEPAIIVDSTALTLNERRTWVRIAELQGCDIQAVYFDVPLAECKRRNEARERVVPEEAMDRLAGKLKAPSEGEGFSRIVRITLEDQIGESAAPR